MLTFRSAPDAVWDKISDFNGLHTWHPTVAKSEIVSGSSNKEGAVRLLTLKGGGTITEKLLAYDHEGRSFTYEILEGVLPVTSYVSTVAVKPGNDGGSVVAWKGSFSRKSMAANPPAGEDD